MKLKFLNADIWSTVFAQIDLKDAVLTIQDGGAEYIEVKIGAGNLTYSEKVTREYTLDRGLLDEVRDGDEVPMDIRFDFVWEYIKDSSSGATPTVEDALKRIGAAADWVSTDADACRPYAVDLVITYTPTPSTCGDKEIITLSDFRYESLDHDLRAGTVAVTGKSNATMATVVRSAQT